MKEINFIPLYAQKETVLHGQNALLKALLLLGYFMLILLSRHPTTLLGILMLLILLSGYLRLPRHLTTARLFVIGTLLVIILLPEQVPDGLERVLLIVGKVIALTTLLGIFSMTTKISDLLTYAPSMAQRSHLFNSAFYLLNTTLAVIPSVQFDIRQAISAEEVRQEKKISVTHFASWINITVVIIVRTLSRAERFAQTAVERGFSLEKGLKGLDQRSPLSWKDALGLLLFLLPGLVLLVVTA